MSHREATRLTPCLSFNLWPHIKMAASHTGRLGSQSDQFSGSQETSASLSLTLSLCLTICLEHVDGVTEMASCASSCCALITRFKGSRVSLSRSRWQRGGEGSSAPPWLNSCTSDPYETDVSPHLHCPSSTLAARVELLNKKKSRFSLKKYYRSQPDTELCIRLVLFSLVIAISCSTAGNQRNCICICKWI